MYNIFNIRKWMQGDALLFLCCNENKLRNRGAVLRGDEVEKELHNGGSKQPGMYQKKPRFTQLFSECTPGKTPYFFHLSH